MGIGEDYYPLPWSLLSYNPQLEGYEVNISEEQLKGAPRYSAHETWDWVRRGKSVDDYYHLPPYRDSGPALRCDFDWRALFFAGSLRVSRCRRSWPSSGRLGPSQSMFRCPWGENMRAAFFLMPGWNERDAGRRFGRYRRARRAVSAAKSLQTDHGRLDQLKKRNTTADHAGEMATLCQAPRSCARSRPGGALDEARVVESRVAFARSILRMICPAVLSLCGAMRADAILG